VSAGTGHGPGDDELPEGFTVPDDLSALFASDEAPGTERSDGPRRAAGMSGEGAAGSAVSDDAARDDAVQDDGVPDDAAQDAVEDRSAGTATATDATAGTGEADAGLASGTAAAAGVVSAPDAPQGAPAADDSGSTEVPDDLSSLTDPAAAEAPSVALVVTQVAAAGPLAAACALAGVAVDVVPTHIGALAVLRDARAGAAGAEAISKLLKTVPVILLERRSGQITATRWSGGQQGDELPPGLVLSDAPAVLEDLLLGGAAVADLEGVVTSVGLSRWKAMRLLAQSARGMRG
jgi:hypothetical protein